MEIIKAKTKKGKASQKQETPKPSKIHASPYLCDLCDFRRNKDDPDKKGFKCNTGKRKSVRYKGCPNFEIEGSKIDAFIGKNQGPVERL